MSITITVRRIVDIKRGDKIKCKSCDTMLDTNGGYEYGVCKCGNIHLVLGKNMRVEGPNGNPDIYMEIIHGET